jgi:hypothetical protein
MNEHTEDGWNEYQKLVLHELQSHTRELEKIQTEIKNIHIELATLRVKSGMWGLLAGAIPVVIAMLLKVLE